MNICKTIAVLLLAAPVQLMAQETGFQIQGKAPKVFDGKKIYLDYSKDGFSVSDSATIVNGKFAFRGLVDEPNFARMVFDPEGKGKMMVQNNGDRLYYYLGNEKYDFLIKDSLRTATITGSPLHTAYAAYLKEIGGGFMDIIDAANKSFSAVDAKAADAEQQYADIKKKYDEKFQVRRDKEIAFAQNNPNSMFSVDALVDAANQRKLSEIEPIFNKLSKEVRQLSSARQLEARIAADKSIKLGNMAPEFVQPDTAGRPVSLADFKGKYVLIDFWASWCGPCRAENPNLLEAYQKYENKGLHILAVSLDDVKGRNAWLKAIKDDGMPWVHVADLKGWANEAAVLYGVRAVPQNYLLDPEGKIIALNLRGEKLHDELAKVFGN
ncbi:AhpC/TSA family protein [Sphingobacterium griseoflavum]|uniref:Thiol:disulfide interchange protein n=1 Tax=Sphingobacterium griseoflavum TaxID=1474952 RepID=A0ABQ3HXI2_9SPHI|nr:AhpC/TSA family protein [Sphingobacterium griseoflavum]GHE44512.1 thiol:disulfide interchange protein [Sphingobacterium griseoflavum]